MAKKYLCPRHHEDTPSVEHYGDHGFCFGCHQSIPLEELGAVPEDVESAPKYYEDLTASMRRIGSLPTKNIRGFQLPFDSRGYYLVWPSMDYYKLRLEGVTDGNKYRSPAGHKKPWFDVYVQPRSVAIVEGEFNALSLHEVLNGKLSVVSPGGAGDFYARSAEKELRKYATYDAIYLVVDADKAGAQAAIETKAKLIVMGANQVRIILVERDFNDILCQDGKEALREEAKRLGL